MAASLAFEIERTRELPRQIDALVDASLAEGFAFVERLRREWMAGTNRFERPGEAFFVARSADGLLGVCGLNRDPFGGDDAVGRLRRLYVLPSERRRGIARALTTAALDAAEIEFSLVRLRSFDREAVAFYRSIGFSTVEGDPNATHEFRLRGASRSRPRTPSTTPVS